ncbi:hypothetical protein GUITHDRAFT_141752 [Guillardia theta CCMP2712]|uniref:Uncharacterized protein n=1 Tax=Guillardia theta (strain CCMP2712) TaxID=905079 RepID=L1IZT5_GUITC|nr:hypothetical protein GUITHDRAFT_141752 [Guillardia theta CCMP2712]EKX41756.1 hypothetical protein GUITHDRAFT_141752 [Guillardia theta CCMP2712]|eukprot:XP_005828736.1 hypothetical protein GUITHDRAFT_141752 [Guillardia theta CCMP2712]
MSSPARDFDGLNDNETLAMLQEYMSKMQLSSEREKMASVELLDAMVKKAGGLVGLDKDDPPSAARHRVLHRVINLVATLCEDGDLRSRAVEAHMLDLLLGFYHCRAPGPGGEEEKEEQEEKEAQEEFKCDVLKCIINLIPALQADSKSSLPLVELLLKVVRSAGNQESQVSDPLSNHAMIAMVNLAQRAPSLHMEMVERGLESVLLSCLSRGNVHQLHALKLMNVMCTSGDDCRARLFSETLLAKTGALMRRCQELSIQPPLKLSITMCAKLLTGSDKRIWGARGMGKMLSCYLEKELGRVCCMQGDTLLREVKENLLLSSQTLYTLVKNAAEEEAARMHGEGVLLDCLEGGMRLLKVLEEGGGESPGESRDKIRKVALEIHLTLLKAVGKFAERPACRDLLRKQRYLKQLVRSLQLAIAPGAKEEEQDKMVMMQGYAVSPWDRPAPSAPPIFSVLTSSFLASCQSKEDAEVVASCILQDLIEQLAALRGAAQTLALQLVYGLVRNSNENLKRLVSPQLLGYFACTLREENDEKNVQILKSLEMLTRVKDFHIPLMQNKITEALLANCQINSKSSSSSSSNNNKNHSADVDELVLSLTILQRLSTSTRVLPHLIESGSSQLLCKVCNELIEHVDLRPREEEILLILCLALSPLLTNETVVVALTSLPPDIPSKTWKDSLGQPARDSSSVSLPQVTLFEVLFAIRNLTIKSVTR